MFRSESEVQADKMKRRSESMKKLETWVKDSRLDGLQEDLIHIANKNQLKALLIAEKLSAQDKASKYLIESGKLTETTFSTSFGVTPDRILKTTMLGMVMSNRPNWMIEEQLTTMNDVYWYIKKTRDDNFRGATSGEKLLEVANYTHANELMPPEAVGTGNGSTVTFTMTTSKLPVKHTVQILTNANGYGYAYVASDNGTGAVAGTALSAGTIDYTNGNLSVTFGTAPATGVLIKIQYHYNAEDPTLFAANQAGVNLIAEFVKFYPREKIIGMKFTDMARLQYDTVFNRSLQDDLMLAMAQEMSASRDYEGIVTYNRMANSNPVRLFDAKFGAFGENHDIMHVEKVWDAIKLEEAAINNELKRGGNFTRIIAATKAAIYLSKSRTFDASGEQEKMAGSWYIGKRGKYEVYETITDVTTLGLAEDECLLINFDPSATTEPAAVAGVVGELDASLRTPNFVTETNICRVEDIARINDKFVRKLKISNIDSSLALG